MNPRRPLGLSVTLLLLAACGSAAHEQARPPATPVFSATSSPSPAPPSLSPTPSLAFSADQAVPLVADWQDDGSQLVDLIYPDTGGVVTSGENEPVNEIDVYNLGSTQPPTQLQPTASGSDQVSWWSPLLATTSTGRPTGTIVLIKKTTRPQSGLSAGSRTYSLVTLDASSGRQTRELNLGGFSIKPGDSGGLNYSLAYVDGSVAVLDDGLEMTAIDRTTGRTLWKRRDYANSSGFYSSESLSGADGKMFVTTPDGALVAIDARTGQQVYKVPSVGRLPSSFVLALTGNWVIGQDDSNNSVLFDARTGKVATAALTDFQSYVLDSRAQLLTVTNSRGRGPTSISTFRVATWSVVHRFAPHVSYSLDGAADGDIYGRTSRQALIVKATTGQVEQTVKGHFSYPVAGGANWLIADVGPAASNPNAADLYELITTSAPMRTFVEQIPTAETYPRQ
jgi:hypothetical protein